MEEKSNSGGGNWEAEHAIGAYDDLIINTKEETLTITMFELLKIEHALEHQHSSNFESDHEMLHEERYHSTSIMMTSFDIRGCYTASTNVRILCTGTVRYRTVCTAVRAVSFVVQYMTYTE